MPAPPPDTAAATGRVVLVGAGPGDPGLITVRGLECLRRAETVLYDYLANPQLIEACRPDAELICLGKHGRDRLLSQDEVNDRMVAAARAGRYVVRLKSGDPAVFARFGEEIAVLEAAGISYEVVPGITAALAAGSHAGIALTDRRAASAVALVTGHEKDDQEGTKLDYAALAQFPGTLVFYMGVTAVETWTQALLAGGKSPSTPVALIRRCSWPDQTTTLTTLDAATATLKAAKLRPPIIAVVGEVIDHRAAASWFTERPLFGKRILLTRPDDGTTAEDATVRQLQLLGADVRVQPAIAITPPADWQPLDAALARFAADKKSPFDWIVFSSGNGVRALIRRLLDSNRDARVFAGAKFAAIGPATAEALAAFHLRADLIPAEYRAESLAASLAERVPHGEKRFLLIRASRGREVLAETLRAAGAEVEQVVAYQSTDVARPDDEIAELVAAGKVDWITVTSSAIAKSLAAMFGPDLKKAKLASISPITSATLRELGLEPAAEATEFTLPGLVAAILKAEQS